MRSIFSGVIVIFVAPIVDTILVIVGLAKGCDGKAFTEQPGRTANMRIKNEIIRLVIDHDVVICYLPEFTHSAILVAFQAYNAEPAVFWAKEANVQFRKMSAKPS
jgi:hypothetical protein